jgi:hypothetical protein
MVARLQTSQFPTRAAAGFAIVAALLGSGVVGYSLKAPTVVSGPTRVVEVSAAQAPASLPAANQDDCQRQTKRNIC